MSEAVIACPLLLVRKDLIGLRQLFEFLFGFFVPRIAIRVKAHRSLTIRFLQFVLIRVPLHTQ